MNNLHVCLYYQLRYSIALINKSSEYIWKFDSVITTNEPLLFMPVFNSYFYFNSSLDLLALAYLFWFLYSKKLSFLSERYFHIHGQLLLIQYTFILVVCSQLVAIKSSAMKNTLIFTWLHFLLLNMPEYKRQCFIDFVVVKCSVPPMRKQLIGIFV